jgi:hypothetical protein
MLSSSSNETPIDLRPQSGDPRGETGHNETAHELVRDTGCADPKAETSEEVAKCTNIEKSGSEQNQVEEK